MHGGPIRRRAATVARVLGHAADAGRQEDAARYPHAGARVRPDELDAALAKTPAGALANKEYTRDEVVAVVDGKK